MHHGGVSIMRRPFLAQYKRSVRKLRSTGFNLVAIDLALARRLALSVVLGQAAVTVVCALVSWLIAGPRAALSAAMGGGISTAAFLIGETAKIVVVIVLFAIVLKTMKVVPLAMLGTYVATFAVFWIALANMLPPLGGANVPRGRR